MCFREALGVQVSLIGLGMFAHCLCKMPHWHAPVVTNEPLHPSGTNQLHKGNLFRFGEGFDDVEANLDNTIATL